METHTTIIVFFICLFSSLLFCALWPKVYRYFRYGRERDQPPAAFYPNPDDDPDIARRQSEAARSFALMARDEPCGGPEMNGGGGLEMQDMGAGRRRGEYATDYGVTTDGFGRHTADSSGSRTLVEEDLGDWDLRNRNYSPEEESPEEDGSAVQVWDPIG